MAGPAGDPLDAPFPRVIGDGGELGAAGLEVDEDSGKDSPGLVDDGSGQGSSSPGGGETGTRQDKEGCKGGDSTDDWHISGTANSLRDLRRPWSATGQELERGPARFGERGREDYTVPFSAVCLTPS